MSDYSQPNFYKFNQDSLILVDWVKSNVSEVESILDLGAGCGIIGIELTNALRANILSLVEAQEAFRPHLEDNLNNFLSKKVESTIFITPFSDWKPQHPYDLIVSNPPYYIPGHGVASPDIERDIARTFKIDDWVKFLTCIFHSLSSKGKAYVVLKNDKMILKQVYQALFDSLGLSLVNKGDLVILELVRLDIDRD